MALTFARYRSALGSGNPARRLYMHGQTQFSVRAGNPKRLSFQHIAGPSLHDATFPRSLVKLSGENRKVRIGHITDVEGHLDYFEKCLQLSTVLEYNQSSFRDSYRLQIDFKNSDDIFVFGGDVCDHGVGDQIIAESLVDFKRRYPDRVFILLGNRDINKMLFTSCLWPVYDECPHVGAHHLDFFLQNMLGCPNAFESRRHGLALRTGKDAGQITDIEVTESFMNSVKPGGFMTEFLLHAQIGKQPQSECGFMICFA